jgi:hypothetical protein
MLEQRYNNFLFLLDFYLSKKARKHEQAILVEAFETSNKDKKLYGKVVQYMKRKK